MPVTRRDIEELLADCDARGDEALAYACKRALGEDPDAFDEVARLISKRRYDRACALELAQLAGCRQLRYNVQTGTRVAVYNAAEAQLDTSGGAWVVACETHGQLLSCRTLGEARRHAAGPLGWCNDCHVDLGAPVPPTHLCRCGLRVTVVCSDGRCYGCHLDNCDGHDFPDLTAVRDGLHR